ncbi:MAG: hypothetical protein ACLSHL_05715 [Alistipes communis]
MNKNQMAELLYALPDGVVVKGRKSKVVPLCLTLAGVVLLVVNGLLPATAGYEDLKSALVLFGGVIFATGVLLLLVRLFGDSGVPLYGENRVPLVWSERYYPKSAASAVADCLTRHDWARLRSIAQSQVPAIRLVAYHTPDEGFVACQAFEYVELEERPSRSCTSCVPATRRSGVRRYAAEPDGVRHRPVPRDFGSRPDC